MPLAGDLHVLVAGENDPRGRRVLGHERRQQRGVSGLRLLAAEAAPHPPADADDLVLPKPQAARDDGLDLAGVLRRGVDGDLPAFARDREGGLRLQVEMLLAAGRKRPLQDVFGAGERGGDISAPRSAASRR